MKAAVSMVCLAAGLAATGCGYHVAGNTDVLPKAVHTICIPAFGNATVRYKLTDHMAEALSHEFIARTRYRVVPTPEQADAVLRGNIINYQEFPSVIDPATGRASTIQVYITLSATLTERATGKVLYTAPNFQIRNQYEISIQPQAYFEESDMAIDRASREVAQRLVSAILENF